MGTVRVARHPGMKSDVVVKFITGEYARDPDVSPPDGMGSKISAITGDQGTT